MPNGSLLHLRKFLVPEFIFGVDSRHLAGRYIRNLGGRKVLVVTDPGVVAAGWLRDVVASLEAAAVPCAVFSGVSPNPRIEEVEAGARMYREEGCNAILGLGGGSPIDCAKGIGIVSSNRRPILDFEGIDRVDTPMPPLLCIPTTGGTSADISQFAILTDDVNRVKFAVISKAVVPDVSLVDPGTLITLSPLLTACTALDALVHAVEAFVSNAHSSITDLHALEAIRLLRPHLLPCLADPQNTELRSRIMMGSLQAGIAFSNACLGAVHALSHSLGGYLDLPHGECNALLLPHVIAFNFPEAGERYRLIADAIGIDIRGLDSKGVARAILSDLENLRREAGLPGTLREKGVTGSDIPLLAKNALRDPCVVTNPRRPCQRDLEVIYEEAL